MIKVTRADPEQHSREPSADPNEVMAAFIMREQTQDEAGQVGFSFQMRSKSHLSNIDKIGFIEVLIQQLNAVRISLGGTVGRAGKA